MFSYGGVAVIDEWCMIDHWYSYVNSRFNCINCMSKMLLMKLISGIYCKIDISVGTCSYTYFYVLSQSRIHSKYCNEYREWCCVWETSLDST